MNRPSEALETRWLDSGSPSWSDWLIGEANRLDALLAGHPFVPTLMVEGKDAIICEICYEHEDKHNGLA